MNKKEVAELKRRFKKDHATFSRLAGCYVDGNKKRVLTFNEQFLRLEDDELFKYLEIANKVLSGTMKNNLLMLDFPLSEELPGGRQQILMGLRESGLDNEALLENWYDHVIENYKTEGNYLILLYRDSYDVPMKSADDLKLGDSEEIYSYLLCAVCPVELSKPGLGYIEEEQRIGSRTRDWVVGAPETGFLFPAFNQRSTDIHEALFYTRDPKAPHAEFMEEVLGCPREQTAREQRDTFHTIVRNVLGKEAPETGERLLSVQQSLQDISDEYADAHGDAADEPLVLTDEVLARALEDSKVPEEAREKIARFTKETFGDARPDAESMIDGRELARGAVILENHELLTELAGITHEAEDLKKENAAVKEEAENLRKENAAAKEEAENLRKEVSESRDELVSLRSRGADDDADISLRMDEEKAAQVRSAYINGDCYLLIPLEGYESVSVNGEELDL